jgi:hypothetical protein
LPTGSAHRAATGAEDLRAPRARRPTGGRVVDDTQKLRQPALQRRSELAEDMHGVGEDAGADGHLDPADAQHAHPEPRRRLAAQQVKQPRRVLPRGAVSFQWLDPAAPWIHGSGHSGCVRVHGAAARTRSSCATAPSTAAGSSSSRRRLYRPAWISVFPLSLAAAVASQYFLTRPDAT